MHDENWNNKTQNYQDNILDFLVLFAFWMIGLAICIIWIVKTKLRILCCDSNFIISQLTCIWLRWERIELATLGLWHVRAANCAIIACLARNLAQLAEQRSLTQRAGVQPPLSAITIWPRLHETPPMNNECTLRIETAKLRIIKIIFLIFLFSSLFEWSD